MNNLDLNIEKLLPLYIEGKTNQEQSVLVETWLSEHEGHREIYETEKALYRDMDSLCTMADMDVEKALGELHGKMRKAKILKLMRRLERIAAIMVIPLLMVVIGQMLMNHHADSPKMLTIRTYPGMTTTATLPDGTQVTLNSNSELTYPSDFSGDERRLALQGEAFFSVTKDSRHPFIVSTSKTTAVKVENMTATLQEGSIAMIYKDKFQHECERKIEPGEKIIYSNSKKAVEVEKAEVDRAMAWISGKLIFRNTGIREVLATLSKRYDVDFEVKNRKVYSNAFTGTLERQRLERVLEILELSSDIKFKYKKNTDFNKNRQTIEVY